MSKKIDKEMDRLADARLPELRARYEEVLGEPTRAPNRVYLLRRIREGLEAKAEASREARGASGGRRGSDGLTKLSVDELRARYAQVVGRSTGSEDKGYLVWKIRMAQSGKVRVGPPRERKHAPGTTQVVPLTLPRATVVALDEVVASSDFKDRSELMRRGIGDLLRRQGHGEVARLFEDA